MALLLTLARIDPDGDGELEVSVAAALPAPLSSPRIPATSAPWTRARTSTNARPLPMAQDSDLDSAQRLVDSSKDQLLNTGVVAALILSIMRPFCVGCEDTVLARP